MTEPITLRRFLTRYAEPGGLDPNLIFLIEDIASACRVIGNRLRNAAFEGNHGLAGDTNVQGEDQKKLDVIADEVFARICENSPRLAALVSEEREDAVWIKDPEADDYLLFYDPLDGSSNIDVNLSVGSIFSICTIESDGDRDVLKAGRAQICSGYAIYGPTMMLVLTVGSGVYGFSCEYGTGDFRLTHPRMTIPAQTSEFAMFNYFMNPEINKRGRFIFRYIPQYRTATCGENAAIIVVYPMSVHCHVEDVPKLDTPENRL